MHLRLAHACGCRQPPPATPPPYFGRPQPSVYLYTACSGLLECQRVPHAAGSSSGRPLRAAGGVGSSSSVQMLAAGSRIARAWSTPQAAAAARHVPSPGWLGAPARQPAITIWAATRRWASRQ